MVSHSLLLFFFRDPFKLAQCWRSRLSASLRKESWNMTATTNALSTAATGSSQGYTVQSCSPQQTSGTPTSSINSKILSHLKGVIRERMQLREQNLNNYFLLRFRLLDGAGFCPVPSARFFRHCVPPVGI